MDGETAKEEGGVVVCPLDAWRIANGMRVFKERAPATSFTKQIAQRKRSSRCGSSVLCPISRKVMRRMRAEEGLCGRRKIYSIRCVCRDRAQTYLYRYKLYMYVYIIYMYDARVYVLPREFRGLERGNGSPTRVCRD